MLLVLSVAAGTGVALFGIWWETALAERVPPHVLSRVTAYDWMGSLALLPIGYVLAGPLGEALAPSRCWRAAARWRSLALVSALLVPDVRDFARRDASAGRQS